MIGSIVFLSVLAAVIFKMVYDHQLYKDINKIKEYGQENEEANEVGVPTEAEVKPRRVGRRNIGK